MALDACELCKFGKKKHTKPNLLSSTLNASDLLEDSFPHTKWMPGKTGSRRRLLMAYLFFFSVKMALFF